MNQGIRYIYNPFILKLIHGKAYYMDKLLAIYLEEVSKVKHDIMKWLLIYNYHVSMIMRDIIQLDTLCEKEKFGVDLYFINFEYTLFRLCEQYVKGNGKHLDIDTDDGLYICEAILKQYTVNNKKEALMRRLCERYLNRVYFDKHRDEYKNRVRVRAQLFFNLKHMCEETFVKGITMSDEVIHYDRDAMMSLMYLYFINEFIADETRTLHKQQLSSLNTVNENTRSYVHGETTDLSIDDITENDDLVFLYTVYDRLKSSLNDHVCGWCIKESTSVNSVRSETDEERRLRIHNEKYNHYTKMAVPSIAKYPLNDPVYRSFISGEDDDEEDESIQFLPLVEKRKFYEAVTYEILFHIRLNARHPSCAGDACNTCFYTYVDYPIYEFNKKCHACRYNKVRYGDDSMHERVIFDRYLKHTVIEVIPAFKGFITRMLYHIMLILYHTDIVLKDPVIKGSREMDLFAMIDTGALVTYIMRSNFFCNIDKKLLTIISGCRDEKSESLPFMSEKEDVKRFALDMAVLSDIIHGIDKQYMTIEKYERSLSKNVSSANYNIHIQMMGYLKLVYIYYTRIMHSIAK